MTAPRRRATARCAFVLATVLASLTACGTPGAGAGSPVVGADPVLPAPQQSLLPTVNIAPARGWDTGATPRGAPGTRVQAFAQGLQHPRWLLN